MGVQNFTTFSDAYIVAKASRRNVVVCKVKEGSSKKGGPFFLLPIEKFNNNRSGYTPEMCILVDFEPSAPLSKPSFDIFKRTEDYRMTYRRR